MPGKNWQTVTPLFQELLQLYGEKDGGLIIEILIDTLNGQRLILPMRLHYHTRRSETWTLLSELYNILRCRFGCPCAECVMKMIFRHFKGKRVTFISRDEIYREARNKKIRAYHQQHKVSLSVLSELFGVDEVTAWRALKEE